jgi:predicted NAD/FAD-dependent oxidoreductase
MTKKIAVIGAGVSGIAATKRLVEQGFEVSLFDQGKSAGGRLGLRTLRNSPNIGRNIDVGAAYFTAQDQQFIEQKDKWIHADLVFEWTEEFQVYESSEFTSKKGPMRYAVRNGLKNLVTYELEKLKSDVQIFQESKVEKVSVNGGEVLINTNKFDSAVLAMPAVQAIKIVENEQMKKELSKAVFNPVLVAWLALAGDPNFSGIFVNQNPDISLLINEGSKQKDSANIITIYSTHEFAGREINDLDLAKEKLINSAREILEFEKEIIESGIMRWTYAQPEPAQRPFLAQNLAIVGDAYDANPRIEAAWLDGSRVLDQLAAIL